MNIAPDASNLVVVVILSFSDFLVCNLKPQFIEEVQVDIILFSSLALNKELINLSSIHCCLIVVER